MVNVVPLKASVRGFERMHFVAELLHVATSSVYVLKHVQDVQPHVRGQNEVLMISVCCKNTTKDDRST